MALIDKIQVGGEEYKITLPEGLTDEEKEQARNNIGAISATDGDVVRDGTYPDMTVGTATHALTTDNATHAQNADLATNSANAISAENAENDGYGNEIALTYLKKVDLLNKVYPVGSIYITTSTTSPASLFGGSWTAIRERFILGANDNSGDTTHHGGGVGGEANHTLGENEIPTMSIRSDVGEGLMGSSSGSTDSPNRGFYPPNGGFVYGGRSGTMQVGGAGAAHNNMPPYFSAYIWRRIA